MAKEQFELIELLGTHNDCELEFCLIATLNAESENQINNCKKMSKILRKQ